MRDLNLSDKERLFLATQYEILAVLKDDADYALKAETLRRGHKSIYDEYFDFFSENLPDAQAQHVINILGIFGDMKASYQQLTDKTGIDEKDLVFPGFDGNNESELHSFAQSLLKHGRFEQTLGEHVRNSHMPTTDMYRRMIERWTDLGSPRYPYEKRVIQEIIAARTHPDYRAQA